MHKLKARSPARAAADSDLASYSARACELKRPETQRKSHWRGERRRCRSSGADRELHGFPDLLRESALCAHERESPFSGHNHMRPAGQLFHALHSALNANPRLQAKRFAVTPLKSMNRISPFTLVELLQEARAQF